MLHVHPPSRVIEAAKAFHQSLVKPRIIVARLRDKKGIAIQVSASVLSLWLTPDTCRSVVQVKRSIEEYYLVEYLMPRNSKRMKLLKMSGPFLGVLLGVIAMILSTVTTSEYNGIITGIISTLVAVAGSSTLIYRYISRGNLEKTRRLHHQYLTIIKEYKKYYEMGESLLRSIINMACSILIEGKSVKEVAINNKKYSVKTKKKKLVLTPLEYSRPSIALKRRRLLRVKGLHLPLKHRRKPRLR